MPDAQKMRDGFAHRLMHPLTSRMPLAVRVAVLTTGAVAITLALVSSIVYITVRSQFLASVDDSMFRHATDAVQSGYTPSTLRSDEVELLSAVGIRLLVVRGGDFFTTEGSDFPFDHHELDVSIGKSQRSARTLRIADVPYRVVAVQAGPGEAFVMAQSLETTWHALTRLQVILWLCSAGGVLLAGIAGWAVASNGLRPVRRLRLATERVARTRDLRPIPVTGHDELARLGTSFNHMLRALDEAQSRERQLVADAGHELRTPLTSMRTNLDLLVQASTDQHRSLPEETRLELLADLRAQADELTTLVGDLVELARDEPLRRDPEPLDLVDIVEAALERVRLRAGDLVFDVALESSLVVGEPQSLERAVTNLLDNAVKWSPPHGAVRVHLAQGVLTISDEGPGISPEDLPHVFDRFYRSSEARTLPGSGLGLSIVQRAALRHGGEVGVTSRVGAGSTFTLRIPLARDDHQATPTVFPE